MEQFIHKWLFMFFLGKSVDNSSVLNCFSMVKSNVREFSYFLSYLAYFHCHTDIFRTKTLIRNIRVNFVIWIIKPFLLHT